MSDPIRPSPQDAPLNPALKAETERVYPTRESSPAPLDTTAAKEGQGEGWPIAWLVVTILCVGAAIYFLI